VLSNSALGIKRRLKAIEKTAMFELDDMTIFMTTAYDGKNPTDHAVIVWDTKAYDADDPKLEPLAVYYGLKSMEECYEVLANWVSMNPVCE